MSKLKRTGGLVAEGRNNRTPILLFPGVSYVSRAIFEKYGAEFLRKISGVEKIIVIETEKSS